MLLFSLSNFYCGANVGTDPNVQKFLNWYWGPSNNDPRYTAFCLTSGLSAIIGVLLVKRGIEQTLAPPHSIQPMFSVNWFRDCARGTTSRFFGGIITFSGAIITLGSLGLLIGNKEILTEYNKLISGCYT